MLEHNEPFKITTEAYGKKFIAELPWDATLDEILDAFVSQMIAHTWQPDTIASALAEKAEHMKEDFNITSEEDLNIEDEDDRHWVKD